MIKKIFCTLLSISILIMSISIIGCSKNEPSEDDDCEIVVIKNSTEVEETTEEEIETEKQETVATKEEEEYDYQVSTGERVYFDTFSIVIPQGWVYCQHENSYNQSLLDFVTVYEPTVFYASFKSNDSVAAGKLFVIERYDESSLSTEYLIKYKMLGKKSGNAFICSFPTDMQWMEDKYESVYREAQDNIDSTLDTFEML